MTSFRDEDSEPIAEPEQWAAPSREDHAPRAPRAAKKRRAKPWIVTIVCLLGATIALAGVKAAQIGSMIKAGKAYVPPAEAVASAKVESLQLDGAKAAIGTLVAVRAVMLGAEAAGIVREITFDSGSNVKQGAALVKLDTSTEEAQLTAAQADASLARLSLERARRLREVESNSQADLDVAEARSKQADAAVASLRTTIAKKTTRAPFGGRIAIRQVELGQFLSPGAPIASLQSISPIHAEFWFPQQSIAELKVGQQVRVRTDAFPDAVWNGEITTVNPEVDVATRNVRMRATFSNQDGRLRPGMFVNVEVLSSEKSTALVIPATSVLFAPYGDSVFVIEDQREQNGKVTRVARQRFVRLGERQGDFVAVISGLTVGEMVVRSGAFKLRNGVAVAVNDALTPGAELAPKPSEN